MTVRSYLDHFPTMGDRVFVDESAVVIGRVSIGEDSSVWPTSVLRGDVHDIRIGARTNIQDGSVLHCTSPESDPPHGYGLTVGNDVTVGHRVILHGCTIGAGSLIGMGATILNGARIGARCLVGANALVTEGKEFPDNSLIMGSPAKAVRTLDEQAFAHMARGVQGYIANWRRYSAGLRECKPDQAPRQA